MTPSMEDLITKVGQPGTLTTLQPPGHEVGGDSILLTNPLNFTTETAVIFSMQLFDIAKGLPVEGSYTVWKGILNGSSIDELELKYGDDQQYPAGDGAQVFIYVSAIWANSLVDGLLQSLNPNGKLKTAAVQEALGISSLPPADWTTLPITPTVTGNAGQKEHTLTFAGVNYTDRLQPGSKLRLPRSGTVPTKSMQFIAASSQYASKTSPAGYSFTDDFTLEADIFVDSYETNPQTIVAKTNGLTGGFAMRLTGQNGRLCIYGGSSSQFDEAISYVSVPLNKWVHVAATLDLSSGTSTMYMDGAPVQVGYTNSPATAIAQVGDLTIGRQSTTAGEYANMKIANVRVWSTIRTAAEVRDNANVELTGSETGLVGYFKGNNDFNDSTANNNHLTPSGGATSSFNSHPFKSIEYAIVTAVSYTGSNTVAKIFAGPSSIPTGSVIDSASYSAVDAPFGFPRGEDLWWVEVIYLTACTFNFGSVNAWHQATPIALLVPTGRWVHGYEGSVVLQSTVSGQRSGWFTLAINTPPAGIYSQYLTSRLYDATGSYKSEVVNRSQPIELSAQQTLSMFSAIENATGSESYVYAPSGAGFIIRAKCAYI